jgi:hypothetical protein
MRLYVLPVVALVVLLVTGCAFQQGGDDFDQGHEWIVPRPAAEIHLSVVDAKGALVPQPILWAYQGEEKYATDGGFVGYDPLTGLAGDEDGEIVVQYLGEGGGGYEVPMNAPGPPAHRLVIDASGYTPASVDLDTLVFVQKYRTGKTSLTIGDETVEMIVLADSVTLQRK